MRLNKLALKDKALFNRHLSFTPHELSVYSFANIYIWKRLYEIHWAMIDHSLCIFFQDKMGCFMYLAPLARVLKPEVVSEGFKIMDGLNKNKNASRIENISEDESAFYQKLGYNCQPKPGEYLCLKNDLVRLKGNRFKSKRSCVNHFLKHNEFIYAPYSIKYKKACLRLYDAWMNNRKAQSQDKVYRGMMEDSLTCLEIVLRDYSKLNCIGRIVKIGGKIKAFTFGFAQNKETFCVLYEITDLSVKGLAQFIFWKLCSELKNYRYINIMDDSGLENLKRVKFSYYPVKLVPAYIITKPGTVL